MPADVKDDIVALRLFIEFEPANLVWVQEMFKGLGRESGCAQCGLGREIAPASGNWARESSWLLGERVTWEARMKGLGVARCIYCVLRGDIGGDSPSGGDL